MLLLWNPPVLHRQLLLLLLFESCDQQSGYRVALPPGVFSLIRAVNLALVRGVPFVN